MKSRAVDSTTYQVTRSLSFSFGCFIFHCYLTAKAKTLALSQINKTFQISTISPIFYIQCVYPACIAVHTC